MLTADERQELDDIEAQINSKDGILYTSRATLNSSVTTLEEQVKAHVLSDEDKAILKNGENAKKLIAVLEKELAEKELIFDGSKDKMKRHAEIDGLMLELKTTYDADIIEIDDDIKELEEKLRLKREKRANTVKVYEARITGFNEEMTVLEKDLDVDMLKQLELEIYGSPLTNGDGSALSTEDYAKRVKGLKERIKTGKDIVTRYGQILVRKEEWATTELQLKQKKELADKADKNIIELRNRKVELIKNSKGIPDRWGITDDYVTFDGVPFAKDDISTSKAVRAIADLMMRMNDTPIMLMGDAESLGYPILDELHTIAEENERIMVFAEHDRQVDDMQLVCYDEMEIPEIDNEPKNLF
jgi:hypothetical protein